MACVITSPRDATWRPLKNFTYKHIVHLRDDAIYSFGCFIFHFIKVSSAVNYFRAYRRRRCWRQRWKLMVATQDIDTLSPIWTFSLRCVLTFVASGLDINGCVLSYFEGTANLHCYTSCTLTTLHCSKVSFFQCCHMKRYNKIFTKMWGVYSLLWDTVPAATARQKNDDSCG